MGDDLVEGEQNSGTAAVGEAPEDPGSLTPASLTIEAQDVIAKADEGGVPMFASANLARIALENGVPVTADMTPNAIIDELRRRALVS